MPAVLLLLVKHGAKYLSAEELGQRIRQVLAEYYEYLGRELLKGREAEFWEYHREKLAELGYPLSWIRLTTSTLAVALDLMLNPKRSFEMALKRLRARSAGPSDRTTRRGSLIGATE
jgi:hypothetical protein